MKLRLILSVLAAGLLSGCAFLNLSVVPFVGAFGAASNVGSLGAGAVQIAANASLADSIDRYGNPPVYMPPFVVTDELRSYGDVVLGDDGLLKGLKSGIPLVGNYETYNEVLVGRVQRNLSDDSEEVNLVLRNSGVRCAGKLHAPDDGWPTEWPLALRNCLSLTAQGSLRCSDGRELALNWRATECRTAFGSGFDRDGGTLVFTLTADENRAAATSDLLAVQISPFPPLPTAKVR